MYADPETEWEGGVEGPLHTLTCPSAPERSIVSGYLPVLCQENKEGGGGGGGGGRLRECLIPGTRDELSTTSTNR